VNQKAVRKLIHEIFVVKFELPEPSVRFPHRKQEDGVDGRSDYPAAIVFEPGDVYAEVVFHEVAHWIQRASFGFELANHHLVSILGRVGAADWRRERKRKGGR